ncbi:reverse transcriptase domain-containing protein [Tanacetum coccineum]
MVSGLGAQHPIIDQVTEEKIQVAIHPEYPKQTIAIGSTLTEEGQKELCGLLRRNLDILAWKPVDMTGVLRYIAEHRLKKRGQTLERNKAIYEEVEKLVDAGIMKEVHYHSWLSNPVMVKSMTAAGECRSGSQLAVSKVFEGCTKAKWEVAKEPGIIKYLEKVRTLTNTFKEFSIKQVPRTKNKIADALSKIASTSFAHLSKQVPVEELKEKPTNEKEVLAVVEHEGYTWITPIYKYLTEENLPEKKKKARAIRRKADARKLIRECNDYQVHRPVPRPITSLWTFYKWGIDIAGLFPEGPGKVKFLIVAIDYFTEWIEAKPVATITGA